MDKHKTYVDMRAWYVKLDMRSMEFDNSIIKVGDYEVLIKVLPLLGTCTVYYMYDTRIDFDKTLNGNYYTEEAYEVIDKCRGDIEDKLFDLFYKYKKK